MTGNPMSTPFSVILRRGHASPASDVKAEALDLNEPNRDEHVVNNY